MTEFNNNESYLDSSVKDRIRQIYVDHVVRLSAAHKRPAFLNALTLAGANAVDANMLHAALPDVNINSVESKVDQYELMVANGPSSMSSFHGNMQDFIDRYKWRPSGIGDPTADGHFIGAYFDYYGLLCRGTINPIMDFVADHRFVKPGHRTIVAVTLNFTGLTRLAVDAAVARSLYRIPGSAPRYYNLASSADYLQAAMSEANPALSIKNLHAEEYQNSKDSVKMFFIVFEVYKPEWANEFPKPWTRGIPQRDGSHKIGSLFVPDTTTRRIDRSIYQPMFLSEKVRQELLTLAVKGRLTDIDIECLEFASRGVPPPTMTSAAGKWLNALRGSIRRADILKLLSSIRSDWNLTPRYA